jgi:hypothetical protein
MHELGRVTGGDVRVTVNTFCVGYGAGFQGEGLAHAEDFEVGLGDGHMEKRVLWGSGCGETERGCEGQEEGGYPWGKHVVCLIVKAVERDI